VLLFCAGFCSLATFSMSLSLVQLTVPDELRGRVISIYMLALRSGLPLGALAAGLLADVFSPTVVIAANSLGLCVVASALLLRRRGTLLTPTT
jgi:hypothetical protein